jgi:predicted RNase H-like nuclease (RuvC/YqgF family)
MPFSLVNPLYYWPAILVSAVILVVGVRWLGHPPWLMLLVAAAFAELGALLLHGLHGQHPNRTRIVISQNRDLNREFQLARQQARDLAKSAEALRQEASQLLSRPEQLELLAGVQFSCDRAMELPQKLEALARRLQGSNSILSVNELQEQRQRVREKLLDARGLARDQLEQLLASLERNIQLADQGEDARQAQVLSLSTVISDAAGVLQQIQNKLRSTDLVNRTERDELRTLSDALAMTQENLDLLVGQ